MQRKLLVNSNRLLLCGWPRWLGVALLSGSLLLAVACDKEKKADLELIPVEAASPSQNLNLTLVAKFDRTSSYHYVAQAKADFVEAVRLLVDAGGCDIRLYPGYVEANSFAAAAQGQRITVPACPVPPRTPLGPPAPPQPDLSSCTPFAAKCEDDLQAKYLKKMKAWQESRDKAVATYAAELQRYEQAVSTIRARALADLERLLRTPVAPEQAGTDIHGLWVSTGELLRAERGRRQLVVVASDLRPFGYQSGGEIPPMSEAVVAVAFFECDEPVACQATMADLPGMLRARQVEFLTPAQSALDQLLVREVVR